MKRCAVLLILALTGCASVTPPVDVSLIPNDCANQSRIIRWLENQTHKEWSEHVAQIKARIWHLRSICNPV